MVWVKLIICYLSVGFGIFYFLIKGTTPTRSYYSLIKIFSYHGGAPIELIHTCLKKRKNYSLIEGWQFDFLKLENISECLLKLRQDGFIKFNDVLNELQITEFHNIAENSFGVPRALDGDPNFYGLQKYKESAVPFTRFDFTSHDLISAPIIQDLISAPSLLSIAQEYINGLPVLTNLSMWWSKPGKLNADSEAAQDWHFDMDRLKWLKFFFYLTDVTEDFGPHEFIRGSHSEQGIPKELRSLGYVRHDHEKIHRNYELKDILTMTGGAGTLIIEDTKGLHRGRVPISGERLILAIEFSSSLFGAKIHNIELPATKTKNFEKALQRSPQTYQLLSESRS